jgi:hypothetical protein
LRTRRLNKAGSRTLRWAAIETAQQPGGRATWRQLYAGLKGRGAETNAAKAAQPASWLIASWHVLAQSTALPAKPAPLDGDCLRQAPPFVRPPDGGADELGSSGSCNRTRAPNAERDVSPT